MLLAGRVSNNIAAVNNYDLNRLMVPENPPPSRGGIEAGLRGAQNRGPGCYGPSPVSSYCMYLYEQSLIIVHAYRVVKDLSSNNGTIPKLCIFIT